MHLVVACMQLLPDGRHLMLNFCGVSSWDAYKVEIMCSTCASLVIVSCMQLLPNGHHILIKLCGLGSYEANDTGIRQFASPRLCQHCLLAAADLFMLHRPNAQDARSTAKLTNVLSHWLYTHGHHVMVADVQARSHAHLHTNVQAFGAYAWHATGPPCFSRNKLCHHSVQCRRRLLSPLWSN